MFSGFVTDCLLAACPTNISFPSLENATIEGVVLEPSVFSITLGFLPSIIATHEFVVPRSMPIILLIFFIYLYKFQTGELYNNFNSHVQAFEQKNYFFLFSSFFAITTTEAGLKSLSLIR